MKSIDSISIADIIKYAYTCHNYETAAPIIHLLDKYCGTTRYASAIDELKQYFKSLHYGVATTCATCANEHTKERLSRDERVQRAITAVIADGVMCEKRDFAIIHRLILDYGICDTLTYADFVRYLRSRRFIPSDLLPSASSLSKVLIRGTYPNWRFIDVNDGVAKRFMNVAVVFVRYLEFS